MGGGSSGRAGGPVQVGAGGGRPAPPGAATLGAVAAGHPATVAAVLEVLRAGGNAYDGVVAAGFAAAVAEPCLTSLGGGGFLLARTAAGEEVVFDMFVDTPGRGGPEPGTPAPGTPAPGTPAPGTPAPRTPDPGPVLTSVTIRFGGTGQVFHVGAGSVAVPGCLPGYLHVHRRLGRLPLETVVAPAIRLAEEGVVLGHGQASIVRLLRPIFELTEAGRTRFVPPDRPFGDDERYHDPELAAFLDRIARGEVTGFADPAVAGPIEREQRRHGGLLTAADLAAYQVIERAPLVVEHGGVRVITNPPPSFGGRLVGRALELLAAEGPAGPAGSGPRLAQLARVLELVTREHQGLGEPVEAGLDATEGAVEAVPSHPVRRSGGPDATPRPARRPRSVKGTTHVSVVDREGNLAAMTTSNGSGSGVVLGDTGVFANNIMGEEDLHPGGFHLAPPGVRVGSMMAPTVLVPTDAPPVALGSGGSERIRSALTQVIANLIDDGMGLAEAVHAPRLHWDGRMVQVEPGFTAAALEELAASRPVNVWAVSDLYFGGVNAVDAAGHCAGDHRRGGSTGSLDEVADPRPPAGADPAATPPG